MFSPVPNSLDLNTFVEFGRLLSTPCSLGTWAILPPASVQNHAPQLCWVSPELLACVWMAGGQEGTPGMSIWLSFLSSDSCSWSGPQLISQDSERSEQNPILFVAGNQLFLVHTAQTTRTTDNDSFQSASPFSMQWMAKLRVQSISIDRLTLDDHLSISSESWSRSTDLLELSAFCRNPPIQRLDGSWLLPIYRSLEEGGAFGHDHSQVLVLSPVDAGLSVLDKPFGVPASTGRVHGSIVFSEDHQSLIQFFRSRLADRIYYSKSDLDGLHWSSPQPTQLPNNNSSIQAKRLMSGRLAMIFNRFCFEPVLLQEWGEANWPRTRWPLSIALSEDDGVTWPWIRDIDTGFGFCGTGNWTLNGQLAYPSMVEGQPGELHIAYSWAGRNAIRYMCLQENDIIGFDAE